MEYRISREDLPNSLLANTMKALYVAYSEIGADVYVVGATARDIGLMLLNVGRAPRRTLDLDVAVLLTQWKEYDHLKEILIQNGFKKAREKQKFHYNPEDSNLVYEVDIVPFGEIAQNDEIAWPPEGDPVISVKCFSDVMGRADTVFVDDDFHFKIAPLSGQWLIKLETWYDRHLRTGKDAADMVFLLENAYISFLQVSDTLPDEVSIEAETFDLTVAGAEWIASDIAKMLSDQNRRIYADLLLKEVSAGVESALLNDLFDRATHSSFDSLRLALARMGEIISRR